MSQANASPASPTANASPASLVSSESASIAPPAESATTATTAVPDPVNAPGDFLHDVRDSYRSAQWALLVVLALYGLARLGQWAASTWKLAWLQGWKLRGIVAVVSVFGALLASIGDNGTVDWRAVFGAVAAVVALYLRPDQAGLSLPVPSPSTPDAGSDPAAPSQQ